MISVTSPLRKVWNLVRARERLRWNTWRLTCLNDDFYLVHQTHTKTGKNVFTNSIPGSETFSVGGFHPIFCQWQWNRRLIDSICIYSKGKIYNSINIAATTLAETSVVTTYEKTSSCTRGADHTWEQFSRWAVTSQAAEYATSNGRKFRLIQSASISILTVEQLLHRTSVKDKTSDKLFSKNLELKPICS